MAARDGCRPSLRGAVLSSATVRSHYAQASPARLLPLRVPQVLVMGVHEDFLARSDADAYVDAATRAGDRVRLLVVPDAGHFEIASPRASSWPQVEGAIRSLLEGRNP